MMTAQAEWREMVKVNIRPSPETRRLSRLKEAVHEVAAELSGVPLREIMEHEYKDRRRLKGRWLLTWGLSEVLGMGTAGICRHLQCDRTTIKRACRLAVTRYPHECQELWRRCNP